ncbi:MAG: helix-turn-helix transcriptional regulator, partial [Pseudomonadota bacterium]
RTLARRLADEGASYQAIVDGVRRRLAESYLDDTALSLAEIAFLLGYADQSSFTTAFKRWTGATPGERRAIATA